MNHGIFILIGLIVLGCAACTERVPTSPSDPGQPTPTTPPGCSYEISPITREHDIGQLSGTVNVTAPSTCRWAVSNSESWLTFSPSSSAGNGIVTYSVAANDGPRREGRLTIADRSFLVVQAGTNSVRVSPATLSVSPYGQFANVTVTVGSGFGWTATSSASWVTFTAGASASGSGSGTFTIRAEINPDATQRSATATVTGPVDATTIMITQADRNPQPSQYDGQWTGGGMGMSTAATLARVTVSFGVLDGVVTFLRIDHTINTVPGTPQAMFCTRAGNFSSVRINNGEFSQPLSGSTYAYGFSGRFTSSDAVSGTVEIRPGTALQTEPWCLAAIINWQATKR